MTTDLERAVEAARRLLTGMIDREGDDTNLVARALLDLMEWRAIETAPRYYTAVLGFQATEGEHQGRMAVVWWNDRVWRCADYPGLWPTHWLPLPLPPTKG